MLIENAQEQSTSNGTDLPVETAHEEFTSDAADATDLSVQNEILAIPAEPIPHTENEMVGMYDVIKLSDSTRIQTINENNLPDDTESVNTLLTNTTIPRVYEVEEDSELSMNTQIKNFAEQGTQAYSRLNYLHSITNQDKSTGNLPCEETLSEKVEQQPEPQEGTHDTGLCSVEEDDKHITTVLGQSLPDIPPNKPSRVYYDSVYLPDNPAEIYDAVCIGGARKPSEPEYDEPYLLKPLGGKCFVSPMKCKVQPGHPDSSFGSENIVGKEPNTGTVISAEHGNNSTKTGPCTTLESEKIVILGCTQEYSQLQWQVEHSNHHTRKEQLRSLYSQSEEHSPEPGASSADKDTPTPTECSPNKAATGQEFNLVYSHLQHL